MNLTVEVQKELLNYHWWFDLDRVGWVHIRHFGINISIRESELIAMANKHGKSKEDVTILMGG